MPIERMSSPLLIVTALVLGALWGCKQREGEVCRCAADCADGLVCAVGTMVLAPGTCGASGRTGTCIPNDDLPTDTTGTDPIPFPFDMGTKLDLGGTTSDSGSGDSGSGDSGSGDSGSDGSGSDGSGTGDSGSDDSGSDTGSSDTGSSDSGSGDSGSSDSGSSDTGTTDSGSGDSGTGGP